MTQIGYFFHFQNMPNILMTSLKLLFFLSLFFYADCFMCLCFSHTSSAESRRIHRCNEKLHIHTFMSRWAEEMGNEKHTKIRERKKSLIYEWFFFLIFDVIRCGFFPPAGYCDVYEWKIRIIMQHTTLAGTGENYCCAKIEASANASLD